MVVQGPDNSGGANNQGDNGFECDGDDARDEHRRTVVSPRNPTIYNATIISP
jgi:hypothetical protein